MELPDMDASCGLVGLHGIDVPDYTDYVVMEKTTALKLNLLAYSY
jgi:hypothetical protein